MGARLRPLARAGRARWASSDSMKGQGDILKRLAARTPDLQAWEAELALGMDRVEAKVGQAVDELCLLRKDVPQWRSAFSAVKDIANSKKKHLFRPQLVFLGYASALDWDDWTPLSDEGESLDGLVDFAAGVELQHLFMFVHDDMMDHAMTRRGFDTIQVAISRSDRELRSPGQPGGISSETLQHLTTLVGDVLQAKSLQLLASGETRLLLDGYPPGPTNAVDIILNGSFRAGAAQFDDILGWSGVERVLAQHQETSATLLERLLEDKASFHSFAAPLIAGIRLARSGHSRDLEAACELWARHVGAAFQGVDDVMDFVLEVKDSGKDRLQDLQEGRLSLPLFLLRKNATTQEWEQVYDILGSGSVMAPADRHHLLRLIEKYELHRQSLDFVSDEIEAAKKVLGNSALQNRPLLSRGLQVFLDGLVEVSNSLKVYAE